MRLRALHSLAHEFEALGMKAPSTLVDNQGVSGGSISGRDRPAWAVTQLRKAFAALCGYGFARRWGGTKHAELHVRLRPSSSLKAPLLRKADALLFGLRQ